SNKIADVAGLQTTNGPIYLREADGVLLMGDISAGTGVVDIATIDGDLRVAPFTSISGSNVALNAQGVNRTLTVGGSLFASVAANNLTATGDIVFDGFGVIKSGGPTTMTAGGRVLFSGGNTTLDTSVASGNTLEVAGGGLTIGSSATSVVTIPKLKISLGGSLTGPGDLTVLN